jgi:hypothetical protein
VTRETRQHRRAQRLARALRSPWPAGLHADLLGAALLTGEPALAAWRAWRAHAVLDGIDQASFRLLPLLYRNLERLGVDDDLMPTLRGIYRRAWVANQVLLRRLSGVLTTLHDAGVPTMVLKGAALADQAYRDAGARPMADLDVWVPAAEFPRAFGVLVGAGWTDRREESAECAADPVLYRSRNHAVGLRTVADRSDVLDLHQDIFRLYWQYHVPVPEARFWDAAEPCSFEGVATRRLAPHHQLLHVCFHGLQSQPLPTIRWVADVDALVRARAGDLDWDALLADARELSLVDALRDALLHVAETYGTPVPAPVLASLRGARVSIVERLERPLRRREVGIVADWCAAIAPLLRHARRPGAGFLRARGAEHARRAVFAIPWEHLVRAPWRTLRGR